MGEFPGCNIETACNYDPIAICADNGLCVFPEPFVDCAGNCINDSDLDFVCDELEIAGCLDSTACNFNVLTTDIVTCEYPEEFYNCDGDCQSDNDNDGICDEIDVEGCTDPTACNYNAFALIDDNMCTYPGCTDTTACNYQIEAACEDGSRTSTSEQGVDVRRGSAQIKL